MKNLLIVLACACMFACAKPKAEELTPAAEEPAPKPAPVEIADPATADPCKAGLVALSNGDIDGLVSAFADNAVWRFNNGDSIAGKAAITTYWKDRRANTIEKISFSEEIWLAVQLNDPIPGVVPGKWVFGWFKTDATYKRGKSMTQWIHTDYHFNTEGKIDFVIQYLDRLAIAQAMPKK